MQRVINLNPNIMNHLFINAEINLNPDIMTHLFVNAEGNKP